MGATILPAEVRGPEDIDRAFATIGRMRADGLLLVPDPSWARGQARRIADLAIKNRLPAISTVRVFADAGGLMAYGTNFHDLWRRAATYVDKILKGAKPAELPVEQPTRFDLVINLKTARALGLTIPKSVQLRADDLIE